MIISVSHSITECAANIADDLNFLQAIEYHVIRSLSKFNTLITTGSFNKNSRQPIDYVTLANSWNIFQDRARQKIDKTTQRGVRTVLHLSISRRYPTNDRGFRYDQKITHYSLIH